MFPMSSFDDTYTPLPPVTETQPTVPGPTFTSIGSFEGHVDSTPMFLADILNAATGFQGWNYGVATALMVQENPDAISGDYLFYYPYAGSQAFVFAYPAQGWAPVPAPFWLCRNRSQIESCQLGSSTGVLALRFQFFVGNPNVGPA